MFNKLYYCTSLKLKEGSIIEKGLHPLDFKKGMPFAFNNYNYIFIEMVLELVRLENFQSKPKRSECVFVSDTKQSLQHFIKEHRNDMPLYYYEVNPTKEKYNYHIGDFNYHNLVQLLKDDVKFKKITYKDFYNHAYMYWSSEAAENKKEIVINCPIKIIKEFDF